MRSGIYSSGMIATYNNNDIVLFKTNIGHSGEFFDKILENRDWDLPVSILMSDALPSKEPTGREVVWSLCNVHCRRQFTDIQVQFPEGCEYVVGQYDKIFLIERETKNMTPDDRLNHYKVHSEPLFSEMVNWIRDGLESRLIEPDSNLGVAANYLLKHEAGLRKFLEVPGAKLDNNFMERVLKLVVLGRKNYYFLRQKPALPLLTLS